jgi:hypothetical protein
MNQIFSALIEQSYRQSLLLVDLLERVYALEKVSPEARDRWLNEAKTVFSAQRSEAQKNFEAMRELLASMGN